MSKLYFRGFIPAVTKYVKSKPIVEVIAEVIAFGFLAPLAIGGILSFIFFWVTGEIVISDSTNFGILG
tara:strand:+ start:21 stop:224 length:204 start_codon:yes stop_codon:yes gene_type:complete